MRVQLALVDEAGMRETRFVSYSGPYSLGDRLPPDEQGREWIVIAVEETNGVEQLTSGKVVVHSNGVAVA